MGHRHPVSHVPFLFVPSFVSYFSLSFLGIFVGLGRSLSFRWFIITGEVFA